MDCPGKAGFGRFYKGDPSVEDHDFDRVVGQYQRPVVVLDWVTGFLVAVDYSQVQQVLHIDRFGNLLWNLRPSLYSKAVQKVKKHRVRSRLLSNSKTEMVVPDPHR